MKLAMSPGLTGEIEALEVDTFQPDPLDPIWTAQKQAFVDAVMAGTRRKDGGITVELDGLALVYAARENGAFDNTVDILADQAAYDLSRWPVLRAARNALGKVRA